MGRRRSCHRSLWRSIWEREADELQDKIKAAGTTGQRVESLESIMDIVSRYADCPNESEFPNIMTGLALICPQSPASCSTYVGV